MCLYVWVIDSSMNKNSRLDLKQQAKALGVDVSAIVNDLKVRVSTTKDQEFTFSRNIGSKFIEGIAHYIKRYQLHRLIIGRICTDGPGELSIWVYPDSSIVQECPTCMQSKTVSFDYVYIHLDEPNQIVRYLIWEIVRSYEEKRKRMETYCSSIDEINW